MKRWTIVAAGAVCLAMAGIVMAQEGKVSLRLATTTSTYETGLLDYLLPPFEKKYNVTVQTISVGTGKAMKIAENGDVDVILVHAREAEDKFVAEGFGVNRRDVMYNDFIIMGPPEDPAGIAGLKSAADAFKRAADAFKRVADGKHAFVSRGDESGTHIKEKQIWSRVNVTPGGEWYLEVGQGMGATLRMADEKGAYVLTDRATYLACRDKLKLRVLVEGDGELKNRYGIIVVSPYRHAHVKYDLAMALVAWMTSPECQEMIAGFKKGGEQLFFPEAAGPGK